MSDPGDAIRRRDELLQMMYWLRGEGLGDTVGPEEVGRLLTDTARDTLPADLEALCGSGLAEPAGAGRYRLTQQGIREGGRRFDEEFSDYIKAGHGACSDPACDCHALGPDACVHAHEVPNPGGGGA